MTSCPTLVKSTARDTSSSLRGASVRQPLGSRQTIARTLAEGEILRVRVFSGHLWVTLEGHADDHLLAAGDLRQFTGPGRLVAEGIGHGAEFGIG